MPATVLPAPYRPVLRVSPWFGGNMPAARLGLILNLLVPLSILIWDARHGKLGADPVNYATLTTGLCAVTFLLLSLAVTPLRMVSGWTWLTQFRRSFGVYAFYYGCVHLFIYFWWDRGRSLDSTVYEIAHRYYLTIGFGSLVLMAPLWATSFNGAIQSMGATQWKRLHRLAYVAAGLACFHFYLQTKADKRMPDLYIAILAALLLWRATVAVLRRWRTSAGIKSAEGQGAKAKASFWKGDLKVIAMSNETPQVRTLRLAPALGGPIPFVFQAGQFLSLSLQIDGKRMSRSYTIASPPTRDKYIEVTIKREENGKVSRFLHDMLMTGQGIHVSAPGGRFTFDPKSNDSLLLIAGGVGITPVMSILRDLTDRRWPGKIDLLFSVRSAAEIIFRNELQNLTGQHPNLHVHVTVTRDVPADWSGLRGRITAELLRQYIPDAANRPTYVCGPDAMAAAVRGELRAIGTPADRINVESFTPSAAVATENGSRPAAEMVNSSPTVVTFSPSGRSIPLRPNQTILEAAEAIGISIDYQCRSGICGTCRCRLLSGQVTMPTRDALSDADEAAGYILACQAHAVESVTVEA